MLRNRGVSVTRPGMPTVTYYCNISDNDPRQSIALSAPSECWFMLAFKGVGNSISANCKVTYDDCTTFIYKQMIRLHPETYGMTTEGEPVWNICAQPKIITKPGMMENEEVTVIRQNSVLA
eukprot:COSAG01_NODE_4057_length_5389_cov_15.480340_9_plen_121_part_00